MGNCTSSRRKIPIPKKQGISTAIKNVIIEDLPEEKKIRRSFSKGSIISSPNINFNNIIKSNNEIEKNDNLKLKDNNTNKIFKSKSKSKEKSFGDYNIKNFFDYSNNDNNSNNNISKYSFVKNRITTNSLNKNIDNNNNILLKISRNPSIKSSKCKLKNKIPRATYNSIKSNIYNSYTNNISTRNNKIKSKNYNNKENINTLNTAFFSIYNNKTKTKEYKCIKTIEGHKEKIVSMIELSNGAIATGSYDKKIKIWNIESLNCIKTIDEEGYIFCLLEFEPNKLLSGTNKNTIQLYNLNSDGNYNIPEFSFKGHELWVNCLIKCSDDFFASGSNDAEIKIWDYKNKKLYKILKGHNDCILAMILLKDKKICSGSADLSLRIWDWELGICLFSFNGHEKWIKCLCQLDKEDVIISGADDMKIKIWKKIGNNENNINNEWTVIKEYIGHRHSIRTLCKINEDTFASGSFDGSIKIWNLNENDFIQSLEGHKSYVISIIKIKNGDLVSCSNDHTIKIWRII